MIILNYGFRESPQILFKYFSHVTNKKRQVNRQMNNGQVITPEIITDRGIKMAENRHIPEGCWTKTKLEKLFDRPRETINRWDYLLINLIPDYCDLWPAESKRNRRYLSDYHRWVLAHVDRWQNRQKPWKTQKELANYIARNIDKLTLVAYMERFV